MKKLLVIITLLISIAAYSQKDMHCQSFLNNIEKYYRAGNYLAIMAADSVIKTCSYNKEELSVIYKYLIPTYLNMGYDSLAQIYTYKFLKNNPFYEYNPQLDPFQLQSMLLQYYTFPKITIGYLGGIDRVFVDKINVYSLLDSMDYDVPYSSKFALTSFSFLEYNFTKNISMGAAFGIAYYNYSRIMHAYNFLEIFYMEKSLAYTVNLYLKAKLGFLSYKHFSPYIKAGGYGTYSPKFYSEVDVKVYNDTVYPNFYMPSPRVEQYTYLPEGARYKYRYGYMGGLGFNMNFQRFNLFLEGTWTKETINYIPEQGRYIPDLLNGFYYISDDFYLNKLFIQAGVSFNMKYVVKKKFKK